MAKVVWVDCPTMNRQGMGSFPHYAACIAALPFARQIKADGFVVKEKGVRKASYTIAEVEAHLQKYPQNKALMNMGHPEQGHGHRNLNTNGQVIFRGTQFKQPPNSGLYQPGL